ncbi:hypothetical protein HZH68_009040 [Vespula germanica]|uniref:Uncharacterized protein n=1 Tax=Vespula germanica TaxID=30212 RepID=A0A834N827_VESGE|nr:hypothetical protein HZH68_009040 [Vespula germanica]
MYGKREKSSSFEYTVNEPLENPSAWNAESQRVTAMECASGRFLGSRTILPLRVNDDEDDDDDDHDHDNNDNNNNNNNNNNKKKKNNNNNNNKNNNSNNEEAMMCEK